MNERCEVRNQAHNMEENSHHSFAVVSCVRLTLRDIYGIECELTESLASLHIRLARRRHTTRTRLRTPVLRHDDRGGRVRRSVDRAAAIALLDGRAMWTVSDRLRQPECSSRCAT
jgi:hypothetical protein